MAKFRWAIKDRGRWLAVFILCLFVTGAVPVLADSSEAEEAYAPSPSELAQLPSAADTNDAIAELKEREADQQGQLESPAAGREREETQEAYAGVSAAEAESLLRKKFSDQLALIASDPARTLTDAKLDQVLGATGARVTVDDQPMLLEGSMPVRTTNDEGNLAKLDLNLAKEGDEYAPVNPLTDVSLPIEASEGIEVGSGALIVKPELPEGDSIARRLGEKDLLYFETQRDTDLLASPLSNGVELSSLLRSVDSPENLRFDLELPAGSDLQADGEGGATVAGKDGAIQGAIPPPTAVDAQGASVPVQLEVDNGSLMLHVPHREQEVAYPIYVDPYYQYYENWIDAYSWYNGQGLSALDPNGTWTWSTNNGSRMWGQTTPIYHAWGGSNRGLFVSATSTSGWQYGGTTGQWTYEVPGGSTYIVQSSLNPFWQENYGCNTVKYTIPLDFDGIWSPAQSRYITFHLNDATYSGWSQNTPNLGDPNSFTGRILALGLTTWEGGTAIPCWRDLYAGGVSIYLDDQEFPTLGTVTGAPTKWVSDATPLAVQVSASDAGLGIQNIKVSQEGGPPIRLVPLQNQCSGLKQNRCYPTVAGTINFNAGSFPEGESSATVIATDPLTKPSANQYSWTMKVDRTSPELNLSGQLASITNEGGESEHKGDENASGEDDELSLPSYQLTIKATDGTTTKKRSGVKNIEIYLDNKSTPETVPWSAQECPTYSCAMEKTYTLNLTKLTPGPHTLKVVGVDQVGNKTVPERKVEFEYVPATGLKDDYAVHHIPLPDGQNHSEEEVSHGPELAVNVINGNLVYHEQDLKSAATGLELERFYNSQLPDEQNTEWGDGWTLSQAPGLKIGTQQGEGGGGPVASVLGKTGSVDSPVGLPAEVAKKTFDPELQATISKTGSGGYEITSEESGGTAVYGSEGQILESRPEAALPTATPSNPVVAATTLCKSNAQRPECFTDDRYRSGSILSTSASEVKIETSLGNMVCTGSALEAELSAEAGEPLPINVSTWTLASCTLGATSCSASAQNIPTVASLKASSNSGEFKVGGGSTPPGWLLKCGTTLECTVSFEPGFIVEGGSLTHIIASKKIMGRAGPKCPTEAKFSAIYTINSPKPAYLEALGFPATESIFRYSYTGSNLTKIAQAERAAEIRPSVDLQLSSGLVASASGAAGSATYVYASGRLTSAQSPSGKTTYEYDASNRMTKITLPNGTTATIAYEATYSRVMSIKVDPAGPEGIQTTTFSYSDNPRETTVTPQGSPAIAYKIAANGSVFRWQAVKVPPAFDDIGGTLWVNRNTSTPIPAGDQTLMVTARAMEGATISSIQIIKDGSQLITEKTCADDPKTPTNECAEPMHLEWVTNTAAHAPGYLNLEVVAKDSLGQSVGERFFDNVPYTAPPAPNLPIEPTFEPTLKFREDFGLDIDLKGDEEAIHARVWKVLNNWELGESVARGSMDRWGAPLYPADVAELEYRERYIAQDGPIIRQWGESNALGSYAGYYVDHRAGGLIRVGFTSNQAEQIAALKQASGLIATDRIVPFLSVPTNSLASMGTIATEIPQRVSSRPDITSILTKSGVDVSGNTVLVGATNPAAAANYFSATFGANAPIQISFNSHKPVQRDARSRSVDDRLFAGDWISGGEYYCTLGFGASEYRGKNQSGAAQFAHLGLTAGHCFGVGNRVSRKASLGGGKYQLIDFGKVTRRTYEEYANGLETDGEAIALDSGFDAPKWVYASPAVQYHVSGVERSMPGSILCTSGSYSGTHCGTASEPFVSFPKDEPSIWVVQSTAITTSGDSGGPVWNVATGNAVGLVEGGYEDTGPTWFTPLEGVTLPNGVQAPGLLSELDASGGGPLNIAH